jgi:hypothetical protein
MSIAFQLLTGGLGLWLGMGAGVALIKFWRDTRAERLAAQLDEERAHIVALAQSLCAHRTQLLNTGTASLPPIPSHPATLRRDDAVTAALDKIAGALGLDAGPIAQIERRRQRMAAIAHGRSIPAA